jgi:hypothetical protein
MASSRVFIVASQPLFAQGVQSLLSGQPGIQVVGVATVGPDVFVQLQDIAPDVVIIDTTGEGQGRLVAQVLDVLPDAKVVGLTLDDNRIHIYYQQMKQGRAVEDLLDAVCGPSGWRGRDPEALRLFVLFQEHYGQRILDNIRASAPDTWTVNAWRAPSALTPVTDDLSKFLPLELPSADLVVYLGESTNVAQFLPNIVERVGARAVIAPVDNVTWLPDVLVRQLRTRLRESRVAIVFPKPFCSLTEQSYNTGRRKASYDDPWIAEFARIYGRPAFRVNCEGDQVSNVEVVRDSPCGCARVVAQQLAGVDVWEAVERAGDAHHYYPCLATMGVDPVLGKPLAQAAEELMRQAVEVELRDCLARAPQGMLGAGS